MAGAQASPWCVGDPVGAGRDRAGLEPDGQPAVLLDWTGVEHNGPRVGRRCRHVLGLRAEAGSARPRSEPGTRARLGCGLDADRPPLRGPLLEGAVQHVHDVVTVDAAAPPEPVRTRPVVVGVGDDRGVVADPQPLERAREPIGRREHERDAMIRIDDVRGPVEEPGARDVPGVISRAARAVLPPAKVDHDEPRVVQVRGEPLGGDEHDHTIAARGPVAYVAERALVHARRRTLAGEIDRALFDKAIEVTATALRGAMGGEGSQPPAYAAELFREIWEALKAGAQDLPDRTRAGF